jgi:hypothetical protein
MKVAVLGPSIAALHMTRELLALGASVRLFWQQELNHPELIELHAQGVLIAAPWSQVTKRFLLPGMVPAGRSRFADLFRVSFQVNPEGMIAKGLSEQPEIYQKMSDEFMASLKGQLEMFEDVDVVIDASPGVPLRMLGPGGPAIGESRLRDNCIQYDVTQVDWKNWPATAQEIAVIGDGARAAHALLNLKEWWQSNSQRRIFLMSLSATPFEKYLTEKSPEAESLKNFLQLAVAEHTEAVARWQKTKAEWDELDDFVKAKKPLADFPIPRLVVFSGHMVSAVDQLVDKSRCFLTVETSPFVKGLVQPENNLQELKTIGVDLIVAATGTARAWERFPGLALRASSDRKDSYDSRGLHEEVGFFTLTEESSPQRIEHIMKELTQLFSPKGSLS